MTSHAPKREIFDVVAAINIDPKGFHRIVDSFHETEFGLYMARQSDHQEFYYLESWLLPQLGLRINKFHFRAKFSRNQSYYLDIGNFSGPDSAGQWHAEDWYLDVVIAADEATFYLDDIDELFEAYHCAQLTLAQCVAATEISHTVTQGLSSHPTLDAWLSSQKISLTWADPAPQEPIL